MNESATYANADAAPSISDATVTTSDAETQHADVATTVADDLAECTATAMVEPTSSIPPSSATFPEYTKPRRSSFGPLL
jgi:hypothetical protein